MHTAKRQRRVDTRLLLVACISSVLTLCVVQMVQILALSPMPPNRGEQRLQEMQDEVSYWKQKAESRLLSTTSSQMATRDEDENGQVSTPRILHDNFNNTDDSGMDLLPILTSPEWTKRIVTWVILSTAFPSHPLPSDIDLYTCTYKDLAGQADDLNQHGALRSVWLRSGLDWHDMVPVASGEERGEERGEEKGGDKERKASKGSSTLSKELMMNHRASLKANVLNQLLSSRISVSTDSVSCPFPLSSSSASSTEAEKGSNTSSSMYMSGLTGTGMGNEAQSGATNPSPLLQMANSLLHMAQWMETCADPHTRAIHIRARMIAQELKAELVSLMDETLPSPLPSALPSTHIPTRFHAIDPACQFNASCSVIEAADSVPIEEVRGLLSTTHSLLPILQSNIRSSDVSAFISQGAEWGPMRNMAGCSAAIDPCHVHLSLSSCVIDELCGWCRSTSACIDRRMAYRRTVATGKPVLACKEAIIVWKRSIPAVYINETGLTQAQRLSTTGSGASAGTNGIAGGGVRGSSSSNSVFFKTTAASKCHVIITNNRPLVLEAHGDSKMAFHFVRETLDGWYHSFKASDSFRFLNAHVWFPPLSRKEFASFVLPFSNACPRAAHSDDTAYRVCYAEKAGHAGVNIISKDKMSPAFDSANWACWDAVAGVRVDCGPMPLQVRPSAAIASGLRLGSADVSAVFSLLTRVFTLPHSLPNALHPALEDAVGSVSKQFTSLLDSTVMKFYTYAFGLVSVRPNRPSLSIVSRLNKRFVLNENVLIQQAFQVSPTGILPSVRVLLLEAMPLYEQILVFKQSSVLLGMHGSALINSVFMNRGAALVQIVPYHLNGAETFFQHPAVSQGVSYFEYHHTNKSTARYHWHYLDKTYAGRQDTILQQGSECCGQQVYFSFFINQDVEVSGKDVKHVLSQAYAASKALWCNNSVHC
jgi:hypothetical protein